MNKKEIKQAFKDSMKKIEQLDNNVDISSITIQNEFNREDNYKYRVDIQAHYNEVK